MRVDILREAGRRTFSNLADLESIAVLAASRGDGVQGQLEDELRHRELFISEANGLGGYTRGLSKALVHLSEYLDGLHGDDSLLALNVVSERWLAAIMAVLINHRFAPALLARIELDEVRHCALQSPPVNSRTVTIITELERHLLGLTRDPQFIAPFNPIIGPGGLIGMGQAVCDAHEKACNIIGVRPVLRQIRAQLAVWGHAVKQLPVEIEMTDWQKAKQGIWRDANEAAIIMQAAVKTGPSSPAKAQCAIVAGLGRAMAQTPPSLTVCRGGRLFHVKHPGISVRFAYPGGEIGSVLIRRPDLLGWRDAAKVLAARTRRARKTYQPPPDTAGVEDMLLPSATVATVTLVPGVPGLSGYGPFARAEGVPLAVTIGGAENGLSILTMRYDHRCNDGAMLNELMRLTIQNTELILNASNRSP